MYFAFRNYFSAFVVVWVPSKVGFSFHFSSARLDGFVEEIRFVSEMREFDLPIAPKSRGFICCPCVTVFALLKIFREELRWRLRSADFITDSWKYQQIWILFMLFNLLAHVELLTKIIHLFYYLWSDGSRQFIFHAQIRR